MEVRFDVFQRTDSRAHGGFAWTLQVYLGQAYGHEGLPLKTWFYKPDQKEIDVAKDYAKRCFRVYHDALMASMRDVPFSLEEIQ